MNPNLERFLQLFHRGEQVFVGFHETASTHGYVSSITEEGFGLTQINFPSEIIYPWDQFEFVCHPGFKVSSLKKETVPTDLYSIRVRGRPGSPKQASVAKYKFQTKDDSEFLLTLDLPFTSGEISYGGCNYVDINVNYANASVLVSGKTYLAIPAKDDRIELISHKKLIDRIRFSAIGYCSVDIKTEQDLEQLRQKGLTKLIETRSSKSTYWGDPWVSEEPLEYCGHKVWRSAQGYLMANWNGDVYLS